MLTELEGIPPGLLERPARRLHEILDAPTLLHVPGRHPEPVFVAVVLHGNEDTGWEAVRTLLADLGPRGLPRALSLFIGNVAAARYGVRHLEGQPDYNRVWGAGDSPEHRLMAQVTAAMARRGAFASIDIHNNTGLNPHYACVNRLDQAFLHLATLFSRTVVYFTKPDGVQSLAFSRLCPAVTVECGKPGQAHGVDHARRFVEAVLHLAAFSAHAVPEHDYDLFHTVAVVKIPESTTFGFSVEGREMVLRPDLDHLNFRELPVGTALAGVNGQAAPLEVRDEQGRDVAGRYFTVEDGEVRTRVPLMPSMLTLDERVIRQDCLCYLMERMPSDAAARPAGSAR